MFYFTSYSLFLYLFIYSNLFKFILCEYITCCMNVLNDVWMAQSLEIVKTKKFTEWKLNNKSINPRFLAVDHIQEYYPKEKAKIAAESNPSTMTYEWLTAYTLGTSNTITITNSMLGNQSIKVTRVTASQFHQPRTSTKNTTSINKWIL